MEEKINLDKFIASWLNARSKNHGPNDETYYMRKALAAQGLECKDGKIVELQSKPKFNNGDWIVFNNGDELNQIIKDEGNGMYKVKGRWGETYHLPYEQIEKQFHLWTIQDAKPGDILYIKSEETNKEYIMAFEKINKYGNVDTFFRYDTACGFATSRPSVVNSKEPGLQPATEEQRELLFKEMEEAGYTWDEKKFDLKRKPTDKIIDSIIWHVKNSITNGKPETCTECDLIEYLEQLKNKNK